MIGRDFGDYSGKKEPLFTRELVKLCVTNAIKQVFGEVKTYENLS